LAVFVWGAVPTATVNGIEIYYERQGSGPTLLYLNGSGATLASTGMLLSPFGARFELVAHDQRGLGRTAVPSGPYSMADYAADAAGLLDHLGWERCRVVGISFGGMVALELAVTWPERIDQLAVLCTSAGGAGGASYPLHELAGLDPAERVALEPRLLDTRFTPEWLAAHPGDQALADFMAARSSAPRSAEQRRGEADQLEARRHHDVFERLGLVSCPTLVTCGRYDGIAPLPNSEAIAAGVPHAELRTYEGGHAFFVQDPQAFPEIIDFLAS